MSKKQVNERINRLDILLNNKNVNIFITCEPNVIQYLTGFDAYNDSIYLAIKRRGEPVILISPEGTEDESVQILEYCEYSINEYQDVFKNIKEKLKEIVKDNVLSIGMDIENSSSWLYRFVIELTEKVINMTKEIEELMMIKDESEIKLISNVLKLNKSAYDKVKQIIHPEMTEIDLYNEISTTLNNNAGNIVEFIIDLVSGPRTIDIGGMPTNRKLSENDSVIVDLLPRYKGYYGDTTRTFFLNTPTKKQYKAYNVLEQALLSGVSHLKPGVKAEDIYKSVANVIEKNGYKDFFTHHAGHGIGTGFFEMPYFIKKCPTVLRPGMIVTIEPGIYIPEQFGMRIENDYLITKDGCIGLFEYPLDIEEFIVG